MRSPLGFKARVGSALFKLCGGVRDIRSPRFTSGATHLPVYKASIAASRLPHMRVSAKVGCRDLNHRPPARHQKYQKYFITGICVQLWIYRRNAIDGFGAGYLTVG